MKVGDKVKYTRSKFDNWYGEVGTVIKCYNSGSVLIQLDDGFRIDTSEENVTLIENEEYNMNDLISRQDAIDALNKKRIETMEKGQDVNLIWECLDAVNQVSSAQPTADVVSKEKYDELNERYHRLLESATILSDAVREYERREEDGKIC